LKRSAGPAKWRETIMTDDIATSARLMKIVEAAAQEFERQGVAEVLANHRPCVF
jgi:hypothetical protein